MQKEVKVCTEHVVRGANLHVVRGANLHVLQESLQDPLGNDHHMVMRLCKTPSFKRKVIKQHSRQSTCPPVIVRLDSSPNKCSPGPGGTLLVSLTSSSSIQHFVGSFISVTMATSSAPAWVT